MVAAPLARAEAGSGKPPPDNVTLPVAVCVPPATLMATERVSPGVMLVLAGDTVTVGVVLVGGGGVVWLLPQPTAVNVAAITMSMRLSILRLRRVPRGRQKSRNAAIAVPPAAWSQALPGLPVRTAAGAVVATVTVPVLGFASVMCRVLPVKVGVPTAPAGFAVTAAVRVTIPVYPLAGGTVKGGRVAEKAPAPTITPIGVKLKVLVG